MKHLQRVLRDCGYDKSQQVALCQLILATSTLKAIPDFESQDEALQWLVATTQENWLRGQGLERWDTRDSAELVEQKAGIYKLCDLLNLRAEIKPKLPHYDYVLLMGALQSRVETRLAYAKTSFDRGDYDFDTLVMLGGARPLYADKELLSAKLGADEKTEYHMMMHVLGAMEAGSSAQTSSDFFTKARQTINTPMQKAADGSPRRPNTRDTVETWLATKPKLGTVLVISNQPYCTYQDATVKGLLPARFEVETAGHQGSEHDNVKVHLDSLARVFYTKRPALLAQYRQERAIKSHVFGLWKRSVSSPAAKTEVVAAASAGDKPQPFRP